MRADVRAGGVKHAQQNRHAFTQHHLIAWAVIGFEVFQGIEQLHATRHHGVVLHAVIVVADLLEHQVHVAAQVDRFFTQGGTTRWSPNCRLDGVFVFNRKTPNATQKTVAAFHACVVPFQRRLGRRGKHGVQARGVCAIALDQLLRVDAIVFTLAHGAHAFIDDGRTCGQIAFGGFEHCAHHLAVGVMLVLHLVRPKIFDAALVALARINVVEHHALGEQFGERLVHLHQPQVAHYLGPKAGVQQMQNGVLDAANVLVHAATTRGMVRVAHPVLRAFGHHGIGVGWVAIAHEVPRRIHKRVHGVGLAPCGFAADRTSHSRVKAFMLEQGVSRAIRNAVLRQHHRQIFFRHRHRAVLIAMDDGNGRTPITLAAHAPVAQTPSGFFLAQAFGCEQFGHLVDGWLEVQTI